VASAASYEREIRRTLPAGETGIPCFDLVLLGVGTDGHTASLFPDQVVETRPASDSEVDSSDLSRLVVATRSPAPPRNRISFSFDLMQAARAILFLVSGKTKADVVRRVLEDGDGCLPAARVAARSAAVCWVLDREAASGLRGR